MLRVLNLSHWKRAGELFNGWSHRQRFADCDIDLLFGYFEDGGSDNAQSIELFPKWKPMASQIGRLERRLGYLNYFQFWGRELLASPAFKSADLVHLHIVHTQWLGLQTIREICRRKPVVWTWHDLWPLTGHCIQPSGCARWDSGCGRCPQLDFPIPIGRDTTRSEKSRKKALIEDLQFNLHLSTLWMREMVLNRTVLRGSVSVIPFGLSTEDVVFHRREVARQHFDIPHNAWVLVARSTTDPLKNFSLVLEALEGMKEAGREIVLVTMGQPGIPHQLPFRHIDLPWLSSRSEISRVFAAGDIFLAPSRAESFGMMVVEAMFHECVPVVASGTAAAEVVDGQGVTVELGAASLSNLRDGIARAMELAGDPRIADHARRKYDPFLYCDQIAQLYRKTANSFERSR